MAQPDPACAIISADRRSGFVMDINVPRLADEDAADDEGHRRDDDRVPQAVIDVAGRRDDPGACSSDGLVVVHSRSQENSRRLAEFLAYYPVRQRKSCGSALKFGVIAAGEADLYPRFGTTMEWDTAAGQAILEAAGGRVETLAGTPLTYGKPGLKNDGFLAWSRCPAA